MATVRLSSGANLLAMGQELGCHRPEPQHKRLHEQYLEISSNQASMQKRSRSSCGSGFDMKVLTSYTKQARVLVEVAPDVEQPSTPPQDSEHCSLLSSGSRRRSPSIEEAFCHVPQLDQEYLRSCLDSEWKVWVNPSYLEEVQREVDAHKRLVLVDWMVEVVDEFQLGQETLFLAVSLLDRFLSCRRVSRAQLQLLGVTCLWVAAKYEEVSPPVLGDFVEITDNSYQPEDLIAMEGHLLGALQYKLTVPTSVHFLHQFLHQYHRQTGALQAPSAAPGSPSQHAAPTRSASQQVAHLAEYLLELGLLTPVMLRFRPSLVAATALLMAVRVVEGADMMLLCQAVAGAGAERQVDKCIEELLMMHDWAWRVSKAPAVADKYSHRARSCASKLHPSDLYKLFGRS